jgi:predicted amidohydrolase YtcJ
MSPAARAETVFVNGNFLTMDAGRSRVSALAVTGDRIVAVGAEAGALGEHPGTTIVDVQGRTVVPGLIDAHAHIELMTYSRNFFGDVRELGVDVILARVGQQVAEAPAGTWIVLQGTFGQEFPTLSQLDALAPDHPVAIRWSMHKYQLNSAAMRVSGISTRTVAPPGSRIQRDSSGRPTGVLEEGWDLLAWEAPVSAIIAPLLEQTLREHFLANGVTTVNEIAASAAGVRAFRHLAGQRTIPRIGLALTCGPGHQALTSAEQLPALGIETGFGDDWCQIQGLKIFLDGGRDGALRSSGLNGPADGWGLLSRTPQTLAQEVTVAVEGGVQVWVHAIGDLAQEVAVSAVEQAVRANPGTPHRTRIEHLTNEMYAPERLHRLLAAGGIAVPNPGLIVAEPSDPGDRLPPGVPKYALRTLLEAGGIVPGNSDTSGAQPFTCNPWYVMGCMLTRQNKHGVVLDPAEALTVDEALSSFTRDAAYATSQERSRGTLEPGKLADFVVIDQDPYADGVDIASTRALATVVGGHVLHGTV